MKKLNFQDFKADKQGRCSILRVLGISVVLTFIILTGFHHFIKMEFLELSYTVSNLVDESLKIKDHKLQNKNRKFPTE